MNRKLYIIGTIIICGLLFSGCGKKQLPELPNDAIAFEMGLFEDSEHDQAQFGSIEYNGRIYIMYGTVNNSYKQKCALSCIGYIIQNEQSSSVIDTDNTNRRLYTISEDPECNFLMEYDDTVKLMNQPAFYRAIDTNGVAVHIPNYIDALGYEFWGAQ